MSRWHHTVPLNFTQPFKFFFQGRKLKYCAVLGTLMVIYHRGLRGGRGKRRPSVDQRWAAGPGFKGKAERPGRRKGDSALSRSRLPSPVLRITSLCLLLIREEQSLSPRVPEQKYASSLFQVILNVLSERTSCSKERLEAQKRQRENESPNRP